MTREEYMTDLLTTYQLIGVPVNKEDHIIYRLRHGELGRDLIVRSYACPIPIYETLTTVRSPYLPEVFDAIELDDGMIVLEEFINGITVAEIAAAEQYHQKEAFKVVRTVCRALSVLHGMNIVHRDVKPENIMVDGAGRIVLIDLDTARRVSTKSQDTVVMGTVGYASPEQMGLTQTDARTDIYAVGVLLNVLLTGKHPSDRLAHGKAGRIVRKCTQINPDDRYQTADKLAAAL